MSYTVKYNRVQYQKGFSLRTLPRHFGSELQRAKAIEEER